MTQAAPIVLRGDPLAAAVLALRLLESDPATGIFLPLGELLHAEGEVFPASHVAGLVRDCATEEWPAYLRRTGGVLERTERPILLIDPVQAHESLVQAGAKDGSLAPRDARIVDLPRLDPFRRPSRILQADSGIPMDLPILYEPSGTGRREDYTQVLPLGGTMVMVRERTSLGPLLSAQEALLGMEGD